MPTFKIKVKWGKEIYQDVEVNTDEEPMLFKAQLFALTGVQPERQKIMLKGAILGDTNWDKVKLRDNAMVLMMGTKDEDMPVVPVEKTKFIEDMDEREINKALEMPAGLQNLGNTCYMNAVIQCLKSVPELRTSLANFTGRVNLSQGSDAECITAALRDLYKTMDTGNTIPPIIMLQVLHNAFPMFAERGEQGGYQQQDANECWYQMLRMLQQKTTPLGEASTKDSAIDQFLGIECQTELKCVESDEEPVKKDVEKFLLFNCYIEKDVKYLHTGLKNRLQETGLEKHSSVLDRNAQYVKNLSITRLPGYLTITMMRFQFKQKEAVNAKILKDIKFPVMLDMFDMCSPELKDKLKPMRTKFKDYEDWLVETAGKAKGKGEATKQEKLAQDLPPEDCEQWSFPDDLGSNNSGYYSLQAVLTHKGRSSNSGHYVGWVRQKGDIWLKCDDDEVSPVHEEDVLKLSGGGDWHTAYILLYAPRKLPKNRGQSSESAESKGSESTTPAAADGSEKMETS